MAADNGRAIDVVGAGLVGSLLATALARRGYDVTVWERRADPRGGGVVEGRSINLVLTRRGIRALDSVGLAGAAMELTVPVTGRMVHSVDGELTYQPYGRETSECNYSVPRDGLNRFLIDAAETAGATIRFGHRLVGLDAGDAVATFETDDGEARADAGVIIGADGAGSAVRDALARCGAAQDRVDMLGHGYKELTIPAAPDGGPRIRADALHIWPRGEIMLMALANRDGSFTVTLYLPFGGVHGFDALDDPQHIERLFGDHFPDAVPLLPDLLAEFEANPTGSLGTVRCAPWHHGGRVLLIGDAAHAIVPFFGQGMNSGFEDVRVLCELVDGAGAGDGDWATLFAEFDRRRKPQADAIATMALDNFDEMRARVGDPAFLLRKAVEHRLEEVMPTEYRSRYSMVMYSHIPFRLALEAGEIERLILDELCAGVDDAGEVDLERARTLIRERLTPFLDRHGLSLDY